MTIKGIRQDGWPRLSTLGGLITKDTYRSLQGGGAEDVDESLGAKLIALGVCVVQEGGAE
jgi:hypothetical protein